MWRNAQDTGYVYALTLGAYTKVGMTKDFKRRFQKLVRPDQRAVARMTPIKTSMHAQVEVECHQLLRDRVGRTEWFFCTHEEAVAVILSRKRKPAVLWDAPCRLDNEVLRKVGEAVNCPLGRIIAWALSDPAMYAAVTEYACNKGVIHEHDLLHHC